MSFDAADFEPIKLHVGDLRKGMFVCGLDRPWEETPFLRTGFEIETDADLEAVKLYCEHVSIDLGQTYVERVNMEHSPVHYEPHPSGDGKQRSSFLKEIATAEATKEETSSLINSMADSLRFGHSLDIQLSQYAVSECVASILRNPDAMRLMAQMRQKNPQFAGHAFQVCVYSIDLGRRNGLRAKQLEELGTCGLLHDVGNLKIPDAIINKAGALDEEELDLVKEHTRFGRDILRSAQGIYPAAADVAYSHHECLDGSGYPRGLTDPHISLYARIVGLADRYAAITQHSVYKFAQSHLDAINMLNRLADCGKIDKRLCASFVASLGIYPPGTLVGLSSNEVAIVLKPNARQRLRPQLLIVRDAEGNPVERCVDLAVTLHHGKGRDYKIKRVYLPGYLGIDLSHYQNALMQAYDD